MQGVIKDIQKRKYQELLDTRIPEIIKSASQELSDEYELQFAPLDVNNIVAETDESGTEYYSIKAECTLRNRITNERVTFNAELQRVPVLGELGFKIKNNYKQQLDVYERAKGWDFHVDKGNDSAILLSENGRRLEFVYDKRLGPCVKFHKNANKSSYVPVSVFFRAVSGLSNQDLISIFGYNNPFIIEAFNSDAADESVQNCIRIVNDALVAKGNSKRKKKDANRVIGTTLTMKKSIRTMLFSQRYFSLGITNAERLKYFQSFNCRANGKQLYKDIDCNGYKFSSGTILTNVELEIIDKLPINEITLLYNDKIFTLRKFSTFEFNTLGCKLDTGIPELGLEAGHKLTEDDLFLLNDSAITTISVDNGKVFNRRRHAFTLTLNDLYTAFSIWADNLNGLGIHSKQYDLTNRILITFDQRIEGFVNDSLNSIVNHIAEELNNGEFNGTLPLAISGCCDDIHSDNFIRLISDTSKTSNQMADLCNIVAYVAKSNKATAEIGASSATDAMVQVQDLQEGRMDPLDIPESDKIGKVHYRTIMTKTDESGNMLSPFLRVSNGTLVSDEPVYLTAIEESDKYIAQWDETFHNEDGSLKDLVRARCNGNVMLIHIERIHYKEFSPFQNISASHSLIPFPGHSNGKRITMGCNQVKQAVPCVNKQRPFTCAGGESLLGIGIYRASELLREFYVKHKSMLSESEEQVISSGLHLERTITEHNKRTLILSVLAVKSMDNTINLETPYLMGNSELAMFSFCINPVKDNVYYGDDIVAYYNGYSIEKKNLVKCADFGGQKVDDSVFDSGLALTMNLNVVYKTHCGSVIEDGICVSSKLVYDDTLTNIGIYKVTSTVPRSTDSFREEFGILSLSDYTYFNSNGLPVIGTYLKPGMPAISKVYRSDEETSVKYVNVPTYLEGQVIYAECEEVDDGTKATVILANRAYAETGDKMAGRCGNKGVIARVVPESDMPFCEDTGEVADVVLNPLGIPSRGNITQLLEHLLSYCMKLEGDSIALVTPYNSGDVDFVREWAKKKNVHPRKMIDGRTGLPFAREENFGVLPMYKLHHVARKKIHTVGMDAKLDRTFLQPTQGAARNGGQNFGEMETWCLESVGATALLNELFTIRSDDINGRHELISNQINGINKRIETNNFNDCSMQACYRGLCVEFTTLPDEGCYKIEPLTDSVIKSFSLDPISTKEQLISPGIFGDTKTLVGKGEARRNWGWVDLHTKILPPIWIYKRGISEILGISTVAMKQVIEKERYLQLTDNRCVISEITKEKRADIIKTCGIDAVAGYETGLQALISVFENFDVNALVKLLEATVAENVPEVIGSDYKLSAKNVKRVARLNAVKEFIASGIALKDYIITSFPVMPLTYRPSIVLGGQSIQAAFDWHYTRIINASNNCRLDPSEENQMAVYQAVLQFSGLDSELCGGNKHKSLLEFFSGKEQSGHGKIRENVQSKRIVGSGRAAIIPAKDTTRKATELGVPFIMMITMFSDSLYGHFSRISAVNHLHRGKFNNLMLSLAVRDRARFNKLYQKNFAEAFEFKYDDAYDGMTKLVINYLEGPDDSGVPRVVCAGRQPSLHKYSIRAFKPYIVFDKVIHLNALLCKGFNGDFDGDQMYSFAVYTEDAALEALEKLNPAKDFILPKNGAVVLEHSQDIVLGVYCATMLENNALTISQSLKDARYYNSVDEIVLDYDMGFITQWDLVVLNVGTNRYLSTAGRIMFNAIIPGGFTNKQFTNTLRISGVNTTDFRELLYDGIIGSGSCSDGTLKYFKLSKICKSIYETHKDECIDVYQMISDFGFKISDKTGVSLSLVDLDIPNHQQELFKEAADKTDLIERDFQYGLISPSDRSAAILSLYSEPKKGVNDRVMEDLMQNLDRNNNIFIMMDSGARGSKDQLAQMCGVIGRLSKSKTENLETSITGNYFRGLNSFDVHLASYSARTGVASTQNETKEAGYTTHKSVYLASGIRIVENDCGNTAQEFKIEWGDHKTNSDRFYPTMEWYKERLLGKRLDLNKASKWELSLTENGVFTESCYSRVQLEGFHELHLVTGTLIIKFLNSINEEVTDKETLELLEHTSNGAILTVKSIRMLLRHHVSRVITNAGEYQLRYAMTDCCKSLLLRRTISTGSTNTVALPDTEAVWDPTANSRYFVATDKTIQFIEDNKIDLVGIRTTLQCRSKHGICAHCYGINISDDLFPKTGTFVGTESAQAIAEPASQLTMNVINKGGAAGSSKISNGIQIFENLIDGRSVDSAELFARVANHNGYCKVDKVDNRAIVSILMKDKNCEVCRKCMMESNQHNPFGEMLCPIDSGISNAGKCTIKEKVSVNEIIVDDGEIIESGQPLTAGMIHPDSIHSVNDNATGIEVSIAKQMAWINNYYNTFKAAGVIIFARHFEIISHLQNNYVYVDYVDKSLTDKFKVGGTYELNEVLPYANQLGFRYAMRKREEITLRSSGVYAALSFTDVASVAASTAAIGYKEDITRNHSLLSAVAIGENLTLPADKCLKVLNKPDVIRSNVFDSVSDESINVRTIGQLVQEQKKLEEEKFSFDMSKLDSFDLSSLDIGLPAAAPEETTQTEQSAVNVNDWIDMEVNTPINPIQPNPVTNPDALEKVTSF